MNVIYSVRRELVIFGVDRFSLNNSVVYSDYIKVVVGVHVLFSPLSRSLSTLTQPPTHFDHDTSQPDNEEDNTVKYNVQHMDPNDYLDVVTIYNRIIQREPIHPKNYKFSSNRVNYIQM